MNNIISINKKINNFNKKIEVEGDKSLSIRWALLASQAKGKSKAYNLLNSDDVRSTISCLKKLGIKIHLKKNFCEIYEILTLFLRILSFNFIISYFK